MFLIKQNQNSTEHIQIQTLTIQPVILLVALSYNHSI